MRHLTIVITPQVHQSAFNQKQIGMAAFSVKVKSLNDWRQTFIDIDARWRSTDSKIDIYHWNITVKTQVKEYDLLLAALKQGS